MLAHCLWHCPNNKTTSGQRIEWEVWKQDKSHLVTKVYDTIIWSACFSWTWVGALGEWLTPLPFTPEFEVRFPVSAVWKNQKMLLPYPRVKVSIRGREVACSASDRQGSNFKSCIWRTVSSQSSHHPQEVLLAYFSLYMHKGGLKSDSFHFVDFSVNYQPIFTKFCTEHFQVMSNIGKKI